MTTIPVSMTNFCRDLCQLGTKQAVVDKVKQGRINGNDIFAKYGRTSTEFSFLSGQEDIQPIVLEGMLDVFVGLKAAPVEARKLPKTKRPPNAKKQKKKKAEELTPISWEENIYDALRFAVKNKRAENVRIIANRCRAHLELSDNNGFTVLIRAAATEDNANVVNILLNEFRANPCAVDKCGCSALWYAVRNNRGNTVRLLLEHSRVAEFIDLADYHGGFTPLHAAIRNGFSGLVQVLLGAGANVLAVDTQGLSYLYFAENRQEIIQMLADHPNSLELFNLVNCAGHAPLATAVLVSSDEIVQLLIESHPADFLSVDGHALKAFILACLFGRAAIVGSFLDKDTNFLDLQVTEGKTALILAAEHGHEELVKLLVERGADRHVRDNRRLIALEWAYEKHQKNSDLASLLQNHDGMEEVD